MVSIRLLAEMSARVYEDHAQLRPFGWETVATFNRDYFFAVLFHNPATGQYVLANRGSDPPHHDLMDWVNDLRAAIVNKLPPTTRTILGYGMNETLWRHLHDTLLQAAAIVGPRDFYLTGHSLGGAITMMMAAARRLPSVVFNPVSVRLSDLYWDRTDVARFVSVQTSKDIASAVMWLPKGRKIVLQVPVPLPDYPIWQKLLLQLVAPLVESAISVYRGAYTIVQQHLMATLLDAIRQDPVFEADLGWA